MRRLCTISLSIVAALVVGASQVSGQSALSSDGSRQDYTLHLPVDEVVLTFHASDAAGKPVNDIRASEVRLWDNGIPPRRIVAFDSLQDRSLRVGFLMDTSASMTATIAINRTIGERYIQRFFRRTTDEAFVEDFGASATVQPWSHDPSLLQQGIRGARIGMMRPVEGTAVFDAIFRACFYGFGKADPTVTGNVIVLFSDGEDNAGLTTIEEALRACQGSNTTIYAFDIPPDRPREHSTGPKNLRELASGTGGRVFRADDSEETIRDDLAIIESESRNQYRLVYKPAKLNRDGSFHAIEIQPPDRVKRIEVRTGYYAPVR